MRTCFISAAVIAICGFMIGCNVSPEAIEHRYGKPDLISDEAGDMKRFYVPEKREGLYRWPKATSEYYYLEKSEKVVVEGGIARRVNLTRAEVQEAIELRDRVREAPNQLPSSQP